MMHRMCLRSTAALPRSCWALRRRRRGGRAKARAGIRGSSVVLARGALRWQHRAGDFHEVRHFGFGSYSELASDDGAE